MKPLYKPTIMYLGEDQHKWLKKLAKVRRAPMTVVIRQIIDDYMKGGVK